MDLKTSDSFPVLTESSSITSTRIGSSSTIKSYSAVAQAYYTKLYSVIPRMNAVLGKLDDVCANEWLDAMRSSSPPRNDETDLEYQIWLKKYPSALTSLEEIVSSPKCKIALFLDYDGTLSPIVDNPDIAVMSNAMRDAVKSASQIFPTAIISGRSREKVYKFVKITEVYYAGSHGMDIMCPVRKNDCINGHPSCIMSTVEKGAQLHLLQPAQEFLPVINEVFRSLLHITKDIVGAKVEYNKFCLTVHYRLIDEEVWPEVAQRVLNFLEDYPRLRVTHGRKVLEIRPMINWNKGKAVEFLLESLGLRNCDDVLSIYIGDDKTDEDAFEVLRECNLGYGILVSSVPKETSAFYSLRNPTEVMEFLESLVKWKNSMALHEGVGKKNFIPTRD